MSAANATKESLPSNPWSLRRRLAIKGRITFETAWRIGSGREGQTMSDLGVLLDHDGAPILPGSSIKGKLRATCESLAHALGLSACQLDHSASGEPCASDVTFYTERLREAYKRVIDSGSTPLRLEWINKNTCDVCKLFGSPVKAARLRCSDGRLERWANVVPVRDGVVLDRDSHTAVDKGKYDYEVVPAGATFEVRFDLDNPRDEDLALLGAALFDWVDGSSLGGFTSRGLGRFRLDVSDLLEFDASKPDQVKSYLTQTGDKRLTPIPWKDHFQKSIEARLKALALPTGRTES